MTEDASIGSLWRSVHRQDLILTWVVRSYYWGIGTVLVGYAVCRLAYWVQELLTAAPG